MHQRIGFKYENIDLWIYLTVLGIITKKSNSKENDYSLFIKIFSRKYPKFEDKLENENSIQKSFNYVIIIRKEILSLSYKDIEKELIDLFKRMVR